MMREGWIKFCAEAMLTAKKDAGCGIRELGLNPSGVTNCVIQSQ